MNETISTKNQFEVFELAAERLDFKCQSCGQHFTPETFYLAITFYGIFFLVGKEYGYFGINCPSCLKIILQRSTLKEVINLKSSVSTMINFGECSILPQMKYYSSVNHSTHYAPNIGMFDIRRWNSEFSSADFQLTLEKLNHYIAENPELTENYLCSFIADNTFPAGNFMSVWWYKNDQIQSLVQIENEDHLKIFPRYYYSFSLLEDIEQFCWEHYLYQEYLNCLKIEAEKDMDSLRQIAKFKGHDFDGILKANPDLLTPEILELSNERYIKVKGQCFNLASDFMEILAGDSYPWGIPGVLSNLIRPLWKIRLPFSGKDLPKTLTGFDSSKYVKISEDDKHQLILNEIRQNFTNSSVQNFLINHHLEFIKEYVEAARSSLFSYADLWQVKEKYLKLLYSEVKKSAIHEREYVFIQEGNSWKITFNGKPKGGYSGSGFKYLHYLVSLKFEDFSYYQLDDLDGINIRDDEGTAVNYQDQDERITVIASSSGPKTKTSQEAKRQKFKNGWLDNRSKLTPEVLQEIQNEIMELKEDIDEAKKSGDLIYAKKKEKELERIEEYVEDNVTKGGSIKKFGKNAEYKNIRDKINVAIKRALEQIREHDFNAWNHFDNSLYRQHGELCYRPNPDVEWLTG